jgi:superfamily II DNA or RNA helicase
MERIETFCKLPVKEIGMIGGGKNRIGQNITIAMVQSLYKQAKEVAKKTGYLLVDECHRCPSRTFTEAVKAFDATYMTGLSATPWRRDQLSKLIFWYLGDVHHEVDQKMLEETGDILKAEAIIRPTHFRPYFDPINEYSKMLSELTQDNERNRMIAKDVALEAQNNKGVILVLSDRKKHCQALYSLIHYRHGIEAEVMTGDLKAAERRDIVARVNAGLVPVLIATGQLIGEGFDCKELSTLFLATPIRFTGRLIQYLGRILRPAPGKEYARVYDYVDSAVAPLLKAAHARQRIYMQ